MNNSFCRACGKGIESEAKFCSACGAPGNMPVKAASLATKEVPEGIKGWSWGAFLLNWIWAIGNRTWIGLLAMVPYIGLLVAIWLGFKGREMAWKNKEWESIEHFNRVQRKWSNWAVGLTIGSAVVGVVAAIAIPAYQDYARRAQAAAATSEALAPLPVAADLPAPPIVAPEIAASGPIDSNSDSLPTTLVTVAGTLARATAADNSRFVTLNGNPLFNGEDAHWQFPVRSFKLSRGREAILMASSGGRGNSCETLFFFLLADENGMKTTPEFGTCSPQGTFAQRGDVVMLQLPKMGGNSAIVFDNGSVLVDGQAVTMNDSNDPSK